MLHWRPPRIAVRVNILRIYFVYRAHQGISRTRRDKINARLAPRGKGLYFPLKWGGNHNAINARKAALIMAIFLDIVKSAPRGVTRIKTKEQDARFAREVECGRLIRMKDAMKSALGVPRGISISI